MRRNYKHHSEQLLLLLELKSEKLLLAGDGIGHDVLPVDNCRVCGNGTPTRNARIRRGYQSKISEKVRPRQKNIGACLLDIQIQARDGHAFDIEIRAVWTAGS